MKNHARKIISILNVALVLFAGFLLDSCAAKDDSKNFMSAMADVDIFIKNGDVNDALKLLKKSEKQAFSSYARLGIYKRYVQLGEDNLAKKTLEKAYKKLPDNLEIQAVYGNYLLKSGKAGEALKVTEKLPGTKYGSIHAEAMLKTLLDGEILRQVKNDKSLIPETSPLFTKEISSDYYDIYVETGDERWLKNCALIYLMQGDYMMAASLQTEIPEDSENALFWGFVQYDSGNYDVAVKNLENVKSDLLSGTAAALASDSYAMLDDFDSAENVRQVYIERAKKIEKISPVLSVNSALWAYSHKDYSHAHEFLVNAVFDFPDYIPGLLTYGKFAWLDSQPEKMSDLEKSLRKTNLRTMKMQRYDDRPKFNLDDAISRMQEEIEKETKLGETKDKFDDLIVEQLNLEMKQNEEKMPLAKRTSMIWNALEKNQLATNLYPSHLVQFCAQKLLSYGLTEDARNLFANFVIEKFNLDAEKKQSSQKDERIETDIFGGEKIVKTGVVSNEIARLAFGDKAAQVADKMEIWEVEFAAYFALLDGNISAAKRLYEYVNFETGGAKTANASGEYISVSPLCASSSSANLAMIYSSQGEKPKALNLYTLAAGKTNSKKIKSKLLYRIASIQIGMGRKDDAKNSAAYAVSLDPSNADARLLLNQNN